MAIKEGYIVYNHALFSSGNGYLITHFGCRTLGDAVRYCRENMCNLAEIKYGKYEDERYNMTEVGTPKMVGIFKRSKRNGVISYSLTMNGYRYPVERDGSMGRPKKIQMKKKGTPFGL